MTQTAQMILNDLQISPTIKEKINFIKESKLNFQDFNHFRLLINSLENFEPNIKQSYQAQKRQINEKITSFLKALEVLENKIKEEQENIKEDTESDQKEKSNQTFSQETPQAIETNFKNTFFSLLAELDSLSKEEFPQKEKVENLLTQIDNFLLNTEELSDNQRDILEKAIQHLTEYNFVLQKESENINDKESEQNIIPKEILESGNISQENKKDSPLKLYFIIKETEFKRISNDFLVNFLENTKSQIAKLYEILNHPLNANDQDNRASFKMGLVKPNRYFDVFNCSLKRTTSKEAEKYDYQFEIELFDSDSLKDILQNRFEIGSFEDINQLNDTQIALFENKLLELEKYSILDIALKNCQKISSEQFLKDLNNAVIAKLKKLEEERILNDENYKPEYFYNEEKQILSIKKAITRGNKVEDLDYKLPIDEEGNYNLQGFVFRKNADEDEKYFTSSKTIQNGKIVDLNLKELLKNVSPLEFFNLFEKTKEKDQTLDNPQLKEDTPKGIQNTQASLFGEELGLNKTRKCKQ